MQTHTFSRNTPTYRAWSVSTKHGTKQKASKFFEERKDVRFGSACTAMRCVFGGRVYDGEIRNSISGLGWTE